MLNIARSNSGLIEFSCVCLNNIFVKEFVKIFIH